MSRLKKALAAAAAVLLVVVLAYAILIRRPYDPGVCTYSLDLPAVRTLASSLPGDKPREIRVEHLVSRDIPLAIAVTGQPWAPRQFRVFAYQLVFAEGAIVVDTGMTRAQAETLDMTDGYDPAAWQRITRAIGQATAVYVTHEHADHMGGAVAEHPGDVYAHLRLTTEQLQSDTSDVPEISAAARAALTPVQYERHLAVAPGVVLIKAPGHTPGSQMVFIQRADGAELLLTGDTAWLMDNIETEQGPVPFAVMLMKGDRNQIGCELRALNQARASEPRMAIMPGHDGAHMEQLLAQGMVVAGFR